MIILATQMAAAIYAVMHSHMVGNNISGAGKIFLNFFLHLFPYMNDIYYLLFC